ncbi:MAG: hypothetical protein Q4F84_05865 [Fibrobacter sp.]|nr:hypothetical protein [Fibrobacter sp.]
MIKTFSQVLQFQVKPNKLDEFEKLIVAVKSEQEKLTGCLGVNYMKRFYIFDDVKKGEPPRELTKIVKCVKYYAFLEYDTIENCGKSVAWLFDNYEKEIIKLLISPFDIMSGYSL